MALSQAELERIHADQDRVNREQTTRSAEEWKASAAGKRHEREYTKLTGMFDWRVALEKRSGRPIGDVRNVMTALRMAPELRGLVHFNEFSQRVEIARNPPWRTAETGSAWHDRDDTAFTEWLNAHDLPIGKGGMVADCMELAARENLVHPVREYFDALVWDGRPRLSHWLTDYLNAQDDKGYLTVVGRKFFISVVARVKQPGCKADHTLVLQGAQGTGKSSAARILAIRSGWFSDNMPDMHSKDAALQLCGRLIVELAELAAMRRSDIEPTKAFLTRQSDVYRPPYGRRTIEVPRQSVFIATTNEAHFLRDPTGNRRFLPVACGSIDLDALERARDQLYAEAVAAYNKGEAWHLIGQEVALAEAEQRERMLTTELETDIAQYLDRQRSHGITETDVRRVLVEALSIDPDGSDFTERALRLGAQVATAMDRAGWRKVRRVGKGDNRRTLYRFQE